jgi:predicted SprT family Zn-dependent metalloprotease
MPIEEHTLEPLPYHVALRDYLKLRERDLWNWFASAQAQADYTEHLRTELLKSTYRLDSQSHPELYQCVELARERLQLDIPVTLYQAQNSPQANASLFFMPTEGHVVFSGPVLTLLNMEELQSVIGHELAHYHLWRRDNGEYHIADRLLQAVAGDPRSARSHAQSARMYQLYTEIFADRGSLRVVGNAHSVIAGLVKIETGFSQVSAAAYLKQAEEVFARGVASTEGISHPESFIRARALVLWQEQPNVAEAQISEMIEGRADLDGLDVIGQTRLASATRTLMQLLLRPKWFQTPAVLGHARLFFEDFALDHYGNPQPPHGLKAADARIQEYLCFVLLDFVMADSDLDEMPLAAALELSRRLELEEPFEKIAVKELKMKARDMKRIKEHAAELLAKAEASGE